MSDGWSEEGEREFLIFQRDHVSRERDHLKEWIQHCYDTLCAEFHRDYPLAFELRAAFPWVAQYDDPEEV